MVDERLMDWWMLDERRRNFRFFFLTTDVGEDD